nr:hypothetical protein [Tanacetum cinerariifolium]
MGDCRSFKSKEDLTQRISKSVFVTNFPNQFSARDLWNVCNAYGKVVDVYIPLKKSKAGKKFAFVCFLKVDNLDRLADNLCTIWIGRLRLHANPVRYQRETRASSFKSTKDINALPNLYVIFSNEGFEHINITYLGGFSVRIDSDSLSSKEKIIKHVGVASWFNGLLPASNSFVSDERIVWISVEAEDDSSFPFKKLCVITRPNVIINDKINVIVKGQVYWIRVRELHVWTLEFNNDPNDNSSAEGDFEDGVVEHISETKGSEGELVKEAKIDHVSESSCKNNKEDEYENHGESVTLGDFNEVRSEHERFGTSFNALTANEFNHFISMAGFVDLPLEGYSYTWSHKSASKMSKLDRLADLDKLFDQGKGSKGLVNEMSMFLKELQAFNASFLLDMAQKAIVHWSIERDANYKYFHGINNQKMSQLAIRDVLVEVSYQNEDLERTVTYEEIKCSVWDCGSNKSLRPYGFTFECYQRHWKLIDQDVVNAIFNFFSFGKFPPWCNSSFITHIPKTQDAKKIKAMIFKVDFEKAFDSVMWDYKDDILNKFGFGVKCGGLKQGDPLSPFLFILVIKSLHLLFNNIFNAGLYKGIQLNSSLTLSHLFYVDDAVFIGIDLHLFVIKKVGNGDKTLFLEDTWLTNPLLKLFFPRLYAFEGDKHAGVAAKFGDSSLEILLGELHVEAASNILENSPSEFLVSGYTGSGIDHYVYSCDELALISRIFFALVQKLVTYGDVREFVAISIEKE